MSKDETFLLTVTDAPKRQAEQIIESGLAHFNEKQAGYRDWRPLAVLISDPSTKQVLGGLLGRTSLGLLFIDLFFLPDSLRNQGLGSRIMQQAEAEARNRGCRNAVVYTISFQAPGFYERHGYRVFGRIDCNPAGTARVFMSKELA
jgi:GNAT superfamily N-acetyltransferase